MGLLRKRGLFVWYFLKRFVLDFDFNYYIGYIIFASLGYLNPLFSAMLLLDIFKR